MTNLNNYFMRHKQAALSSLNQFSRTPMASFMICLVIGITLTLPILLFVALKNVELLSDHFKQSAEITLFLKKEINENQVQKLIVQLQKQQNISKVYAISPKEGFAELQQEAGFQGILDELHDNPLPWAIIVIPNPSAEDIPSELDQLTQTLKQLPAVDSLQSDILWVKRLATLIMLAKRIVFSLAIFLSMAVLLIVNNTIRSATQHNQKEIEIIKLIGGTHTFIRRPFLYAGMLYGLLGGIIAWQAVDILILIASNPTHHLAKLYHHSIQLAGLGLSETGTLLGCSMALGFAGSWLAVTRYLRTC